jgi:hypothetical protein
MRMRVLGTLTRAVRVATTSALLVGCAAPCTTESIRAQLAGSASGDVVSLAGCGIVEGPLTVPPGVTLRGPGTVLGTADAPAVRLVTASGLTTSLEEMVVEGHDIGVETEGDGNAWVHTTTVTCVTGVGLALGADGNEVFDTLLTGNVTDANRDEARWLSVTSSDEATHGILASRGSVTIRSSSVVGFSSVAISLGEGVSGMETGPVQGVLEDVTLGSGLGIGLASSAATLSLTDVRVQDVWTGVRGWPSYAVLLVDGVATSTGLAIHDADGFGLVAIAGESTHDGLVIERTGDVGVWIGSGVTAEIAGPGARIAETAFAAVLAVDATSLALRDVDVDGVRSVRRTVGVRGAIDVGDGIDLVGTPFVLTDVRIARAERAGLLIDAATPLATGDLMAITVTSEGAGLGAVRGDVDRSAESFTPAALPGWDAEITRLGTAAANDAAFTSALALALAAAPPSTSDAVGVIAPMY